MHGHRAKVAALKQNRLPTLASQMRVAFSSIALNTGSSSPGELEMTRKTSDVAAAAPGFGEIIGALTQFVQEPRVLHGDDGLRGELLIVQSAFR